VGARDLSHAHATRHYPLSVAGVVAALGAEARTLGTSKRRNDGLWALSDGTLVAISGRGLAAANAAAQRLVKAGATSLVSWGMAGGLDPSLAAGTLCIPGIIAEDGGGTCAPDESWRQLLMAAMASRGTVVGGKLFCSTRAIEDVAGKAVAFRQTGASAVDMESMAIARVAAAHGLPFVTVRAIVDTAADTLPATVLAATTSNGVRISRLVLGILRAPEELAPLLRLAQRYRAAIRALSVAAGTGALVPLGFAATTDSHRLKSW
jgi:adenosylhomocysteine nucleosidase